MAELSPRYAGPPAGADERPFGQWVRELRVALDLTQEALAEQIGCATQTLRSFEGGRRRPSRELALRLADALAVPEAKRPQFLRMARMPLAPAQPDAAAPRESPAAPAPLRTDPLIGRQDELAALQTLLVGERRRLVTLLGPGGVGKTRLAQQASADIAHAFADGAAIAALAALSDPADLPSAVAGVVGCPLAGSADPLAALLAFLGERELLLVLDNLEHLLAADLGDRTRAFITALLRGAPHLTILTTSRERVHLQAEWTVELAGLGLPADDTGEHVAQAEAVLLFVERARRVSNRFGLTRQNQAAVAAVCRRLDGLPLALELAASQIAFLPPATLLARLDDALPLLEHADRDLPERQRTMRAAIAWSDDLLAPDERRLFRRLAVFSGSFNLAAAEAVGRDSIAPAQVIGLLRRLVEQSLVLPLESDAEARFKLLEPIRQFALERLEAEPDEAQTTWARFTAYYGTLAETAEPLLRGAEQRHWLELLETDYPNLRAAMGRLLAHADLDAAAHLGHNLWVFLWLRGHLSEGLRWMEHVVARLPEPPTLARARALLTASVLAYGQARHTYAQTLGEASLAAHRALDDARGVADAVSMLGLTAVALDQHEQALPYLAEAVTRSLAVGNRWGAAMILNYWAPIPLARGAYQEAAELARRALELANAIGDQVAVYAARYNLALVAQHEGDPTAAEQHFSAALVCAEALGDLGSCIACIGGLGGVAAIRGNGIRTARLWGAAAALSAAREAAVYNYAADPAWFVALEAVARTTLAPGEWERAWAEGRELTLSRAIAEALGRH